MSLSLDNDNVRNDETFDIIGCDILLKSSQWTFNVYKRFKTVAI